MGPTQLMLCLLSAVFVKSSMLLFRHYENVRFSRTAASDFCQGLNMTLVTLYDEDDAKSVAKMTIMGMGMGMGAWVGLKKISNNSNDYPMCPTTSGNENCSSEFTFKCEKDSNVDVKLNWCAAKQYCQYHSLGDLRNSADSATTDTLWIDGNISDNWAWDDGGCSTYRECTGIPSSVATVDVNGTLSYQPDTSDSPIVCSKGDVRIVVINSQATWEHALDYCDQRHSGLLQILTPDHQQSVVQWLNGTEHTGRFWVGLRQSRVFGFWIWKDRVVNSSYWRNEQPPTMPLSQQCGVIHVPSFKWENHNCLIPLPFLCEERIVWLGKNG